MSTALPEEAPRHPEPVVDADAPVTGAQPSHQAEGTSCQEQTPTPLADAEHRTPILDQILDQLVEDVAREQGEG